MNTDSYKALSNYIDLLLDAICVVDKFGRFEFVSKGAERIFGYKPEEMLGRLMIELVHPDDRERTLKTAAEINAGAVKVDFENRYIRKDGQIVHLLWSARWSATDKRRVAVARDISRSKKIEARQAALYAISEAAFACDDLVALYQCIQQIVSTLIPMCRFAIVLPADATGSLSFAHNAALYDGENDSIACDVLALCAEVIHRSETILLTADNQSELPEKLRKLVKGEAINWLGVPLKSHSAVMGALMIQNRATASGYSASEVELLEFVSVQVAVAIERKQMLQRLQRNALYDQLTQLPNRDLLQDRLQSALARAQRDGDQFALCYLDLDKFKHINDTFGHQVGDELLQQTAQRIVQCLRHSDTVARLGGDEFVVLLPMVEHSEAALQLTEKIRLALNQPFVLAGQLIPVFPSIGVAMFPQHSQSVSGLLQCADKAMYMAKKAGGNQTVLSAAMPQQQCTG